jgi:membrane protein required for colicin V production
VTVSLVDIVIVLLVPLSAVAGFSSGVIRAVFSLAGLIIGIAYASRNYLRFAHEWTPLVHNPALQEAIWFCLLTIAVMLLFSLVGWLVRKIVASVGLSWLDRLVGLAFGFVRGAVLVSVAIVTLAAFYPDTTWLKDSQAAKYFFDVTDLTIKVTPESLKQRVLDGLHAVERNSKQWLPVG